MSYTEYLRRKAAASPVVLNTLKPTDASMYTQKQRHTASRIFYPDGSGIGSLVDGKDRTGYPLGLSHPSNSYVKKTTRPAAASDYTAWRGGQAIGSDTPYYRGRITQPASATTTTYSDWVTTFSEPADTFTDVTYGNGYWVAVDSTNGKIYYTTNPASTTWTTSATTAVGLEAVAYGGGNWAAVNNGSIHYTTDPTMVWSVSIVSSGSTLTSVAYGGGYWVVGDLTTSQVWYSTTLSGTWLSNSLNPNPGAIYVAYGDGNWVAVDALGAIWTAADPSVAWTQNATDTGSAPFTAVAYGAGVWTAVDSSGGIWTAGNPNGTWIKNPTNTGSGQFGGVAYGNGYWVAAERNIWVTSDPTGTWTLVYTYQYDTATGVATDGNRNWVTVSSSPSFGSNVSHTNPLATGGSNCCVPSLKPPQKSASDITREKLAAPANCGVPISNQVFVDDTIRLSAGIVPCAKDVSHIIHSVKDVVPPVLHSARPFPPPGLVQDIGGSSGISQDHPRKVGALIATKYPKYIEKHHGNDLNVNPKRPILPYHIPANSPAHLKINDPTFGNVK